MSKLLVDEIRSADRSVSSSANMTFADDGNVSLGGTLSAGTIGSAVTGTFTEITSGSFTSSGQGPDFGNSHDYDIIEVYLTGLRGASNINYAWFRLASGGSLVTGGNSYHYNLLQTVSSSTTTSNLRWNGFDSTQVLLAINAGEDATESVNAKITIWNAKETTYWPQFHQVVTVINYDSTFNTYQGGGFMNNVPGRITGLKLVDNYQAGKFIAFGAKI